MKSIKKNTTKSNGNGQGRI